MKANYSSRGRQVYGDPDNVKSDTKVLRDILSRQGCDIFLETIADVVGENCIRFGHGEKEIAAIKDGLRMSLSELIDERT